MQRSQLRRPSPSGCARGLQESEARIPPATRGIPTAEAAGTIIVDPEKRFLYLVLGRGRRSDTASVSAVKVSGGRYRDHQAQGRMAEVDPAQGDDGAQPGSGAVAERHAGRSWKSVGCAALYLYQGEVDTLFRIHGTREPESIGRAVSSGCIRMLNADVAELFDRVPIGTKVIVPWRRPADHEGGEKPSTAGLDRTGWRTAPRIALLDTALERSPQPPRTTKQPARTFDPPSATQVSKKPYVPRLHSAAPFAGEG